MKMFDWFQARNQLKTGIVSKVGHTEQEEEYKHCGWIMSCGVLSYHSTGGIYPTGRGPANIRKHKKIFFEVT